MTNTQGQIPAWPYAMLPVERDFGDRSTIAGAWCFRAVFSYTGYRHSLTADYLWARLPDSVREYNEGIEKLALRKQVKPHW